jgi:hypothetical protein
MRTSLAAARCNCSNRDAIALCPNATSTSSSSVRSGEVFLYSLTSCWTAIRVRWSCSSRRRSSASTATSGRTASNAGGVSPSD